MCISQRCGASHEVESDFHTPGEQMRIDFPKPFLLSVGVALYVHGFTFFFALFILSRWEKMNMSSLSLIKKNNLCAINHFVFSIFGWSLQVSLELYDVAVTVVRLSFLVLLNCFLQLKSVCPRRRLPTSLPKRNFSSFCFKTYEHWVKWSRSCLSSDKAGWGFQNVWMIYQPRGDVILITGCLII